MKITVKIDNIEISIDEQMEDSKRMTTMQYSDQNQQIQNTIKVMVEECMKLRKLCEKY